MEVVLVVKNVDKILKEIEETEKNIKELKNNLLKIPSSNNGSIKEQMAIDDIEITDDEIFKTVEEIKKQIKSIKGNLMWNLPNLEIMAIKKPSEATDDVKN